MPFWFISFTGVSFNLFNSLTKIWSFKRCDVISDLVPNGWTISITFYRFTLFSITYPYPPFNDILIQFRSKKNYSLECQMRNFQFKIQFKQKFLCISISNWLPYHLARIRFSLSACILYYKLFVITLECVVASSWMGNQKSSCGQKSSQFDVKTWNNLWGRGICNRK